MGYTAYIIAFVSTRSTTDFVNDKELVEAARKGTNR